MNDEEALHAVVQCRVLGIRRGVGPWGKGRGDEGGKGHCGRETGERRGGERLGGT